MVSFLALILRGEADDICVFGFVQYWTALVAAGAFVIVFFFHEEVCVLQTHIRRRTHGRVCRPTTDVGEPPAQRNPQVR
jgi:hypothetical protein